MKKLILIALAAGGIWYVATSEPARAPDEKLARHFDRMCQIAGNNLDSPEAGVRQWFQYLGRYSPEMLRELGATLVAIERIGDDDAHDRRAHEAADRMHAPLRQCAPTLDRFGRAIENDPEAKALFESRLERFGRTLEILLGADARGGELLELLGVDPRQPAG
jgi:hypothetical protein